MLRLKKNIKTMNDKMAKKIPVYQQLNLKKQTKQIRKTETESWIQRAF